MRNLNWFILFLHNMHRFQDKIKDPYEVTHYSGDLAQLRDVPSFTVVTLLFYDVSRITVCVFNKVAFVVSESSFPHPFN